MTTGGDWERLRALFERALEHPPDERAAFLLAHSDDEAMRSEVESLLEAHEAAEGFLDRPADRPDQTSSSDAARFAPGSQLGAFEILEPLGIGGMGEVYRARDTRLDRQVAIKVLSAEVEIDASGRQRFEREARAISRLSHPHICALHDIGSAPVNGTAVPFLVMELLDGETLAVRLASGALPVEQALRYAIDIAEALAMAHSHGIVHRDLKPANVMVSRSSGVKLLDFGLAQLRASEGAGWLSSTTSDGRFTSGGMVFGTLPYMSPEQLRGEPADARTDIFAFGVLLHEMLTGSRPFAADSQAELIGAILERDPPSVSDFHPLAPASLDRVVRKCLAKHPDDRWQTARDLRSELQWILDQIGAPGPGPLRRTPRKVTQLSWRAAVMGAAAIALCVVSVLFARRLATRSSPPRGTTHLSLNFPAGVALHIPINGVSFAVSPDGGRVAYIGVRRGQRSIFVHALNTGTAVEIPGTAEAANPAFSPDNQWLAFVQSGAVKKVPVAGGPIQVVCVCPGPLLRWLSDGRLVRSGLHRPIQEILAPERPITQLAEGDEGHHTPVLLPGGSLLFTILRGGWHSAVNSVAVWSPNGRSTREIVANATSPALVGRDTIVFSQGHTFFAAPFDVQRMRLAGEARALELRVQPNAFAAAPMYAVAGNGTLVYAERAAGRRLVWVDRQGREEFVKTDERFFAQVRISPDGTRVATYLPDGDRDIWVFGLTRPTVDRLTFGPARDTMPVWSADGSRIFFTTAENRVRSIAADGSSGVVPVFDGSAGERIHPLAMAPDGTRLLIQWDQMPTRIEQRVLRLGPKLELLPLLGDSGTERDGRLSPDGRWVAFQSDESSQGLEGHITVRPFPDVSSKRWVISPGVGRQPIWSRDGRELFYRTEDGSVMSVRVRTTPTFDHDPPAAVVTPQSTLRDWANGPTYDVSPDGRRFLFIKAPELEIHSLHVVLNWDVEVRGRLGGSE